MHKDDPTPHLERFTSYEQACREFRWPTPQRFNIASAICSRHPDAITRVALSELKPAGINTYTFGGLDFLSDKFAMSLSESGFVEGDTIAVMLPPSAALAVAHLGALKAGGVVAPLSVSRDPGSLRQTLADREARFLVVSESITSAFDSFASDPENLDHVYVARDLRPSATDPRRKDFWSEIDRASSDFKAVETEPHSPAFAFYTSVKGNPRGVVHSHASLFGALAAFEMFTNLALDSRSIFWAANDWSSVRVLLAMLYPAWWYGCSVVAATSHHDEFSVIQRCEVTHAFFPAPKMSELMYGRQPERVDSNLQLIVTDEPLPKEGREWASDVLGADLATVYSRPETGVIAGACEPWYSTPDNFVGRVVPGRVVDVVDEHACPLQPGVRGQIAIHISDPALFLRYHNDPATPAAACVGNWFLTGDAGYKSEDGDLCLTPSSKEED
ncbi:MAG TPA: AMP-binding protein [Blastocatellia bacterium]|nr:AMP-binding protein [Blastocatellia bacterium]